MDTKRSLTVAFLALISALPLFAGGGAEIPAPAITLDLPEPTYISPGIKDDVQDQIEWSVTIVASERMVIKGYRVLITDESGAEAYRYEETYPGQQSLFQRMFIGIGFARLKEAVVVPEQLSWDGTLTDGSVAPEGVYELLVEGWDDEERIGRSSPYRVVLDNTPPTAIASMPYNVFSPNSDGNKDILIVEQSGSDEENWVGAIQNEADETLFEIEWDESPPENFTWDGVSLAGTVAPDAFYRYVLSATDLAGNSFELTIDPVTIDTKDTPISITRDVGFFSPNQDGVSDTVDIALDVPITEGVRIWTFEVIDRRNSVRKTIIGEMIPDGIEYDGTDDGDNILPEGIYRGRLTVLYINGNNPNAMTQEFSLDVTPPEVSVGVEPKVFSPNGDGRIDTIVLFQETSTEVDWTGEIINSGGQTVRSATWRGQAESTLVWDGRNDTNNLIPDGTYRYRLSSRDRAGNFGEAISEEFRVDTRETPIKLIADRSHFSPNSDGSQDTVSFLPEIAEPDGVLSITLTITNELGETIRTFNRNTVEERFTWDGTTAANTQAEDGNYFTDITVEYRHGNNPSARIGPIVIDRVAPRATVSASFLVFSPDGDGKLDNVQIVQTDTSEEIEWIGRFIDPEENPVRIVQWSGRAQNYVWNGADDSGNVLPDGDYKYELVSTDRAGNTGVFIIDALTIDTRSTPVSLRIDTSAFSPDGDEAKDFLEIEPVLVVEENVESWTLEILDGIEQVRRKFVGAGAPKIFEYDGFDEIGRPLPEGIYTARLTVLYRNGNQPAALSPNFTVDVTDPQANVRPRVDLFSPNGDGRRDTIVFEQNGSDEEAWIGSIIGESGEEVRNYSWFGELKPSVEWDGKDASGNIVPNGAYTYRISSTDRAGNNGISNAVSVGLDNRIATIGLSVDSGFFSPNADGVQDRIRIIPALTIPEGVANHTLEIQNSDGSVVQTIHGTRIPERFTWDGLMRSGSVATEGTYTASLTVLYVKGDRPEASSQSFVLDTIAPTARAEASMKLFSPEGDGRNDTIEIRQSTSTEDLWEGSIRDESDSVYKNIFWNGTAEDFIWNGTDDNGSVVPDGNYTYVLSAIDAAGNSVTEFVSDIRVDTRLASAFLSASDVAIAPGGATSSAPESVVFNLYPSLDEGIEQWGFVILDSERRVFRDLTTSDQSKLPTAILWDGRDSSGSVIDGFYTPKLSIEYAKGNLVEAGIERPILVDSTAPNARAEVSMTLFSPEGDGRKDSIEIMQSTSTEQLWVGSIRDSRNRAVRDFSWNRSAGDFIWDGTNNDGRVVPDGSYTYVLTSTDEAGNNVTERIPGIRVDTRVATANLGVSDMAIAPGATPGRSSPAAPGRVTIDLNPTLVDGVARWELVILGTNGRVFRDLTSANQSTLPRAVVWDGRDSSGSVVDGSYTPKLTIEYNKGNFVEDRLGRPILVDSSGPVFAVRLSPTPFSPDADGENDTLRIALQRVTDASRIESWRVEVIDPRGNLFYSREGTGAPPASFEWDGTSEDGELVQAAEDYRVDATIVDSLGNNGVRSVVLPVDILVLRDGANLKIRISSIQFAPDSADFLEFDEEKAGRNLKTLSRLAEILGKYADYQIRIEGHAVSVFWANEERAAREQEEELIPLSKARAEAVKKTLIDLGIVADRMTTEGMGGIAPVVPHGDIENRWKSRRVEFILVR